MPPEPVQLFSEYQPLSCHCCGRDLLEDLHGVIGLARVAVREGEVPRPYETIRVVYSACKGKCDASIEQRLWQNNRLLTGWIDVKDLSNPLQFLRWKIAIINGLRRGDQYSDEAFEALKTVILVMSQLTSRAPDETEEARDRDIAEFPFL